MKFRCARVVIPGPTPGEVAKAAALVAEHLRRVVRPDRRYADSRALKSSDRTRIVHAFRVMEALQSAPGEQP